MVCVTPTSRDIEQLGLILITKIYKVIDGQFNMIIHIHIRLKPHSTNKFRKHMSYSTHKHNFHLVLLRQVSN